jgi:hypothetical protein
MQEETKIPLGVWPGGEVKKRKEGFTMRKLMLIVAAIAIAAPALATVEIGITDLGGGQAGITYNCTAGEDVRAFALDITVDAGVIEAVSGYHSGESLAPGEGYGIFPGNFRDYINPAAPDWGDANYTPIAPSGDPDALGGLGTAGVTIELGSLYVDANAPGASGTLCVLTISDTATMCVELNTSRGGVVLEDANAATTNALPVCALVEAEAPCYAGPSPADWATLGEPLCWCGTETGAYQCYGDADNLTQGIPKYRVYTSDYDILSANWKKKITDPTLNPCADFDHKAQGIPKYRVYTSDYDILSANWKKKDTDLTPCP